jgi:hypothetical protein
VLSLLQSVLLQPKRREKMPCALFFPGLSRSALGILPCV